MPRANHIAFALDQADDIVGPGSGMYPPAGLYPIDDVSRAFGYAVRLKTKTLIAMLYGVRQFLLSGHVQFLDSPGGNVQFEGDLSLVLTAIQWDRTGITFNPIVDEIDRVNFGGYAGEAETQPNWVNRVDDPDGTPIDPGPIRMIFADRIATEDRTVIAGEDYDTLAGRINGGPYIQFFGDGFTGLSVGSDNADCLMVTTLPATSGGSFDGFGETGFSHRLRYDDGSGLPGIAGSVTLNPLKWWTLDGMYDEDTGFPV